MIRPPPPPLSYRLFVTSDPIKMYGFILFNVINYRPWAFWACLVYITIFKVINLYQASAQYLCRILVHSFACHLYVKLHVFIFKI